MKYVVASIGPEDSKLIPQSQELLFVFPRSVNHDRFVEALGALRFGEGREWERRVIGPHNIVGAGFVDAGVGCHGRSETPNIASRGEIDSELLKMTL